VVEEEEEAVDEIAVVGTVGVGGTADPDGFNHTRTTELAHHLKGRKPLTIQEDR